MSKNQKLNESIDENDDGRTDLYDDEITDEDYGFVLGPDGELKSVFMPVEYFEIPKNVLAVFKAFGIENPDDIHIHSIH